MNATDTLTPRQRIGRMLDLTAEIRAIHQGRWLETKAERDRRSDLLRVLHKELDEERRAYARATYQGRRGCKR